MSNPHKFHFFRRAVRGLRAAAAIADPAIVKAHRRLAALYLERGVRIGRSARSAPHPKLSPPGGLERREARS